MPETFFLKASTDFQLMQTKSEESLKQLGFMFIRNSTVRLVEFEINEPSYFRVVVEKRNDPRVRNIMLILPPDISSSKGSTVDVRFDLDQDSRKRALAEEHAKNFLKKLLASLPAEPWHGLGFRESRKEKKKWSLFASEVSS